MKINRIIENILEFTMLCVVAYFLIGYTAKDVANHDRIVIVFLLCGYGAVICVNFLLQTVLLLNSAQTSYRYFFAKVKLFAILLIASAICTLFLGLELFSFLSIFFAIILIGHIAIMVLLFIFDTFLQSKPYRTWIGNKSNKILQYSIICLTFVIVIIYLFVKLGVFDKEKQEEKQWRNSLYSNTVEAYDSYLQKYPNGKYVENATQKIAKMTDKINEENLFNKALLLKSEDAVNEYLSVYPSGKYKKPLELMLNSESGKFVDRRDGKEYRWVKIGEQVWMSENLNYELPNSRCYDDNLGNCEKYGRLYKWNEACDACPEGWKLPDSTDFATLEKHVEWITLFEDRYYESTNYGAFLLRQSTASDWIGFGGNNATGFSALPAGYLHSYSDNSFYVKGGLAVWWSSSERKKDEKIVTWVMSDIGGSTYYSIADTKSGHSIRC
ncbi:hypothetical protein LJC11_05005, partial [Bacteroidales bacterium OttesenSCG-928-I21]|nr:hypothetical protein [Bacteroidales bacterium OttesenSCG-928-I21]